MLQSAAFGPQEAADYHLFVQPGGNYTGGVLTLSSQASEIGGGVTNAASEPVTEQSVLLFPADRALWVPQSRRIRIVQPGPDGRFAIRGLPAGEYRLVATIPPESGQQFDPEFLAQISG